MRLSRCPVPLTMGTQSHTDVEYRRTYKNTKVKKKTLGFECTLATPAKISKFIIYGTMKITSVMETLLTG